MCLLIHQPKGVTLPRYVLDSAARKNGDGFGIMYAQDGEVHTFRMIGDAEDFTREYYKRAAGRECFVHWRMTTHGATNKANAHPFRLSKSCAIMHNGIIDIETPNRSMSDTWHFAEFVARPALIAGMIRSPEWLAVARGIIGRGSKVAILHGDGSHVILNRESGIEYNGVWYSNTYAWDAPESIAPQYTGRYHWRGYTWDDEPRALVTSSAPASSGKASSIEQTIERDIERADSGEDAINASLAALMGVCSDGRDIEQSASAWAAVNPESAALLMCDWFNFSFDEALDMVRDNPANAGEFLSNILESLA